MPGIFSGIACPKCGEPRLKSHSKKEAICRACGRVTTRRQLALAGIAPEHQMVHSVPDGFHVKGVSTFYRDDGRWPASG